MNTVVMTAWRHDAFDTDNLIAMSELAAWLDRLGFSWRLAVGSYKGAVEQSVIVDSVGASGVIQLRQLGASYEQECVLVVCDDGGAYLLPCDGGFAETVGFWHEVGVELALKQEAWTSCDGHWFVVHPTLEGN